MKYKNIFCENTPAKKPQSLVKQQLPQSSKKMRLNIATALALTVLSEVFADLDVDIQDVPAACQASE